MKMRPLPDRKEKVITCRENLDHMEEFSVQFFGICIFLICMKNIFTGIVLPKNDSCHRLLTLMLLQNLYDFFLFYSREMF